MQSLTFRVDPGGEDMDGEQNKAPAPGEESVVRHHSDIAAFTYCLLYTQTAIKAKAIYLSVRTCFLLTTSAEL